MSEEPKWIEWPGGECPVDLETRVKIMSRDGYTAVGRAINFMRERWKHAPDLHPDCHIIAYRPLP